MIQLLSLYSSDPGTTHSAVIGAMCVYKSASWSALSEDVYCTLCLDCLNIALNFIWQENYGTVVQYWTLRRIFREIEHRVRL